MKWPRGATASCDICIKKARPTRWMYVGTRGPGTRKMEAYEATRQGEGRAMMDGQEVKTNAKKLPRYYMAFLPAAFTFAGFFGIILAFFLVAASSPPSSSSASTGPLHFF